MRQFSAVLTLGIALAAAGCGASTQTRASSQLAGVQCASLPDADRQVSQLYAAGSIERVAPVYRTEFLARAIQPTYVSGAELYVPAQPGMSQAYLERLLTCHAAARAGNNPSDPLAVANLRDIDVEARGQRYMIRVEGEDRAAGRAIWQRAQALRDGSTQVEVRQLSAAPSTDAQL